MTKQEKILAAYPHVYTQSIHRLAGCHRHHVYLVLRQENLPCIKKPFLKLR